MTLELATEGCCKGHKCDNCAICRSGRCCRGDNPDYKLPGLGEWDGPIYGELGIRADDGDKMQCHFCGEYFRSVQTHAWKTHDLNANEYKAIIGLSRNRGLVGPSTHAKRVAAMLERGNQLIPIHNTPERLSFINKGRPRPLELGFRIRESNKGKTRGYGQADGGSSSYCGVSIHSKSKRKGIRWVANIGYNNQTFYLGIHDTEESAARAYDAKARELYGDSARLNFPDEH